MTAREKQDTLGKFVEREVLACQSTLVEELFKKEVFSFEQIENLYPQFDGKLLTPNVCYSCKLEFPALDSETGTCKTCFENNNEQREVFEWWLVSDWLSFKLSQKGQPILTTDYGTWWGRTCTGQAIFMDYVIERIYDEVIKY